MKCCLLAAAVLLLLPRVGVAQTETRAAVAEALYRQARDLMAAGKYAEACPKFAQSQQLDPATGTLLNLAACHEKQGRLATAWLEYSDALVAARRDGREDRVEYARARAQELEPKLSRLVLVLEPGAEAPGVTIELDGASIGSGVFGVPTAVDPGEHTVKASAPGKKPSVFRVTIGAEAEQRTLTIPALQDAPVEPTPEPAPAPLVSSVGLAAKAPGDQLATRPVPTSVYIAGGITLALAAGAGVTGVAYLGKKADYDDLRNRDGRTAEVEDRHQSAQRFAYVNLGLWAATAVGAGITAYLYVTRPGDRAMVRLEPWVSPQIGGLGARGSF
ncbi:MAG: tetratricopeptide repeat protein [Myxococcales bacterium]|nr:MAG: tetratricopeptide repeat protein [Myxococcales bacterium]